MIGRNIERMVLVDQAGSERKAAIPFRLAKGRVDGLRRRDRKSGEALELLGESVPSLLETVAQRGTLRRPLGDDVGREGEVIVKAFVAAVGDVQAD